jgi:hypothetical protein
MKIPFTFAVMFLLGQAKPPGLDEKRVNGAIDRRVEYLRAKLSKKNSGQEKVRELALLALVHAGVKKGDAFLDEQVKAMVDEELTTVYRTALQAMVLRELDLEAWQKRIFQCAQFLVDNQCRNGQWAYGEPTTYPEPKPEPDIDVKTKYKVQRQRWGPPTGDHSNSQYAILGIRACHESGILFPKEVLEKAAQAWRETQTLQKGWSYGPKGNRAYGSMTAGGVAALTILDYLQEADWKQDAAIKGGLEWLKDNLLLTDNPGRSGPHHYYWLYALSRAALLTGTDKFGKVDWYLEGGLYLLANQETDGSWNKKPVDTCFAILFLRRATRPPVATGGK